VLFAIYVDSLISELRQPGYGFYNGTLFVGCVVCADDIALLSVSCYGLQRLVDICGYYGTLYGTLSSILQKVRLYTLECQLRFCVEFTWMDLLLKLLTWNTGLSTFFVASEMLQFYCSSLPVSYIIDQRRLLFWKRMLSSDNPVLRSLTYFQVFCVKSCIGWWFYLWCNYCYACQCH